MGGRHQEVLFFPGAISEDDPPSPTTAPTTLDPGLSGKDSAGQDEEDVGACGYLPRLEELGPTSPQRVVSSSWLIDKDTSERPTSAPLTSPASKNTWGASTVATELGTSKVDAMAWPAMASGCTMACCAGIVNAVAFRALKVFVSHVTGRSAKVSLDVESGSFGEAKDSALLVLSFVLGSVICGCLIAKHLVNVHAHNYGIALIGNGLLLACVAGLREDDEPVRYVLAAACGLQNALATSWSNGAIRTTHLTGIATDTGLLIGRWLWACAVQRCHRLGRAEFAASDVRKLVLLLLLGCFFILGVFLGSFLHGAMGLRSLFIPAAVISLAGLSYVAGRSASSRVGAKSALEESASPVTSYCSSAPRPPVPSAIAANPPQTGPERLLEVMDWLRPALQMDSARASSSDLQAEALDAHGRLRAAIAELAERSGSNNVI